MFPRRTRCGRRRDETKGGDSLQADLLGPTLDDGPDDRGAHRTACPDPEGIGRGRPRTRGRMRCPGSCRSSPRPRRSAGGRRGQGMILNCSFAAIRPGRRPSLDYSWSSPRAASTSEPLGAPSDRYPPASQVSKPSLNARRLKSLLESQIVDRDLLLVCGRSCGYTRTVFASICMVEMSYPRIGLSEAWTARATLVFRCSNCTRGSSWKDAQRSSSQESPIRASGVRVVHGERFLKDIVLRRISSA